jgi:rod shape-determining protein MreD
MTALTMLFTLVCGAVLQAVLPTWRWFGHANVPILLGIVLYYAVTHPRGMLLGAAVIGGLLQDALGMIPLGYSSFCFCVVALSAARFKDIVFEHEVITHMLFGALAAGLSTLLLYLLLIGAGVVVGARPGWGALKVIGSVILGGVVSPFVFEAMGALDRMLGNVEARE